MPCPTGTRRCAICCISIAYPKAELSAATRRQDFACHVTAKAKAVTAFCHDCPIIFFIALCDPAVALSVAYRQHIQRRNLPCPTGTAALAVADFYNVDINVLESPCTSIVIVLFGTAHIYINRDRSCHHTLACICRYSIAVADVVVLTDNVQL